MIDDYMVRQSNDPRIVVPQARAPKNAVTAASLNVVRDKERNKSEMITDKAYRNQEFKQYLNPSKPDLYDDIKEADWYGNEYKTDDYKAHQWNLMKDVDEPGFASGVDDLARILLDAKKDVKFNKNLTTRDGALYWVRARNKANPGSKPWEVRVTDLNNDKIPEVVVVDGHGNIRYVNGWHLTETKTPLMAAHQTYIEGEYGYPNQIAEKRRLGKIKKGDLSLKDWIYQNTKVIETDPYGPLEVDPVLSRAGYKSRGLNTCNIFMKFITKPIYDEVIEKLRAAGGNDNYIKAVKSAASIISINAKLYTKYVANPVYKELSASGLSDKQMKKKIKGTNYSIYTQMCAKMIQAINNNENVMKSIRTEIYDFVNVVTPKFDLNYVPPVAERKADYKDRRAAYKVFDPNQYLK